MAIRNNVIRLLESRGINFTSINLSDNSKRSALESAQEIGAPPEQVFKTIVLLRQGRGNPILAVIPGPAQVDLKSVAMITGEKKVVVPTQKKAEDLTGMQSGGISPLALYNKGFDILLDEFAEAFDGIYVSGGERGLSILIGVADFLALTGAKIGRIV